MGTVSVDPAALRMAARRLETAADLLGGILTTHLRDLQTGEAGVGDLLTGVGRWAGDAAEVAATLRAAADGYVEGASAAVTALR